jgi:predicted ATP-dependent endonuclease of OLD family
MKINRITVKNFRLLKDVEILPEEVLSLVIGKNNSGKTSLLDILTKFLKQKKVSKEENFFFNDFNIETHSIFNSIPEKNNDEIIGDSDNIKIELKIYIEYDERDSLDKMSEAMLNLDPKDNVIILAFEYRLRTDKIDDLKLNFERFKKIKGNTKKTFVDFLKKNINSYYQVKIRSLESGNEANSIEIKSIDNIIRFEAIGAKRRVSEEKNSYNLSAIVSSYYQKNANQEAFLEKKENLEASLSEIDEALNKHYPMTFEELLETLKRFGINDENSSSEIQIISDISSHNIITNNSSVVYEQDDYQLPEGYHGLGYINLIYIILEIRNKLEVFKASDNQNRADINLLFLEEPEAHMHPQMQYIFIHHIKDMLSEKANELGINLQTIISTHSPHIASQSEFFDIKYFDIVGKNHIQVKNVSDFIKAEDPENIKFLKKYLTVHNSELFFANKAILIEGTTERLLLPLMMQKIDHEKERIEDKLLSQNVSIIEVGGAYAHKFKGLLKFLNIKSLIITDLDSIGDDGKMCEVDVGTKTSNQAIKDYLGDKLLKELKELSAKSKVVDGLFRIAYQIPEVKVGYNARTFEDAWIEINKEFINSEKTSWSVFPERIDTSVSSYELAKKIEKKTEFALDIIFSTKNENKWKTPKYINEGLEWLAN